MFSTLQQIRPLPSAVKVRTGDYLQAADRPQPYNYHLFYQIWNWSVRTQPLSDRQHYNRTSAAGVHTVPHPQVSVLAGENVDGEGAFSDYLQCTAAFVMYCNVNEYL